MYMSKITKCFKLKVYQVLKKELELVKISKSYDLPNQTLLRKPVPFSIRNRKQNLNLN